MVTSEKFTEAIEIEPENHILYSNRSAAYASKKDYENALTDASKVTEIKPDWAKGWGRKGAAMHGLGDLLGAHDAYEEGLKLDPNNAQNKSGLASVNRAIDAEAKAGKLRSRKPHLCLLTPHRWSHRRPNRRHWKLLQ